MKMLKFKVIIDIEGKQKRELQMESKDIDHAIEAATKIAERMGGCFLDVVYCDLA